jgi:hypothetical protein
LLAVLLVLELGPLLLQKGGEGGGEGGGDGGGVSLETAVGMAAEAMMEVTMVEMAEAGTAVEMAGAVKAMVVALL